MMFAEYKVLVEQVGDRPTDWRYGQTAFNFLYFLRPDLSEQIRGGPLDPFHRDERMPEFYKWVEKNWEKGTCEPPPTRGTVALHGKQDTQNS